MAKKRKIADVQSEAPKAYVREKTMKELAVEKLLARGFNVTLESGVIMSRIKTPDDYKLYKQALKDIGYDSSWGARMVKGDNDYEAGRAVESTESEGSEDYA